MKREVETRIGNLAVLQNQINNATEEYKSMLRERENDIENTHNSTIQNLIIYIQRVQAYHTRIDRRKRVFGKIRCRTTEKQLSNRSIATNTREERIRNTRHKRKFQSRKQ